MNPNEVNFSKLDMILESTYNMAMSELHGSLQESNGTDMDLIAGQRFITESVLTLRTLMIEEGIVQNVKDNLLGYAGAAGLGALGMKYYNDTHQPNVYEQAKQGVVDVSNGVKADLQPVFDKVSGVFRDPVTGTEVPATPDQAGYIHVAESTNFSSGPVLNIWEESISMVLPTILENTSESLKAKTIARTILENGSINLEEAEFICNLVDQVITESIDEFIPDEIEVEDMPEEDPASTIGDMELFDADGNKYLFSNGQLVPADSDGMINPMDETDPDTVNPELSVNPDEVPSEVPSEEDLGEAGEPMEGTPADAVEDAAEGEVESEVPVESAESAESAGIDPTAADGVVDPKEDEVPETEETEEDKSKKENLDESTIIDDTNITDIASIGAEQESFTLQNKPQLITESSDVVSRILAKMQY